MPFSVFAQSANLFSTDAELSSSLINQLYQDSKGFIWVATEDGLDRYDGAKFSIYRQNRQDSTSILNNYVKSIFEDSEGILYFGYFNGLQYFDHATEEFHQIPLFTESNETYPAHVTSIIERKNGQILISTSGQGIFLLNKESSRLSAKKLSTPSISPFIETIFEDSQERLWVLSQDNGLFKLQKNGETEEYFSAGKQKTAITSICENKKGKIFVGSLTGGMFQLQEEKNTFDLIKGSQGLPVKNLYTTCDNKILIGTDGNGLKFYDPVVEKMGVKDFSVTNFNFSKTKVHSILEDKTGNLWLGIYQKGVLLIPDLTNNFKYIGYQSIKNNIIGSNSIMSVYKDKDSILWVGTDGDGLYGITENNKQKFHFSNRNSSREPSTIMSIFEDSNGSLWIGSYLSGLSKLNKNNWEFEYQKKIKDVDNNNVERVYSIAEDNDKNLWIGSLGFGLFSLDLKTGVIKDRNNINDQNYDYLHNKWINCILVSESGKIYIGTFDGLSSLNPKENTYLDDNGINHLLSGKIVYSLHEDENLNLWIGTSEGLFLKPYEKNISKQFTIEDGLPSNLISAIEKDKSHNFWISTNNGISQFNPTSETFTNYYFRDGLQGNEFNKNASFADKDNQLYFGSTNGITYFTPSEITAQKNTVDLKITGFYLEEEPVKKGMKSGPYDIITKNIVETDTVNLCYRDNNFSIEFSSFAFKNNEWITYSYSMNNDSWINLRPGINTLSFNHLEPGTYNFKIKAKDYGEFSKSQQLSIIIHPPWYFSTWAKIVYLLILTIITFILAQQIIQRRKTKNKLLEHKQAELIHEAKLQLFTNIAHDIKTPISLIANPLRKLIKIDQHEDRQKLYQVMERNSERILQLIDQLINARKFDKGQIKLKFQKTEIIQFVKWICALFEDQIESRNIKFKIHHSESQIFAWIDPEHFDKIIQNVVSNAIKFTPENGIVEVRITARQENGHFQIIVKDNGIGIKESDYDQIFTRFYRVAHTKSRQFEGTGIGLHLTKTIAELHHGTITVQNNKDQTGCQFIINIPLGKAHLKDEELQTEKNSVKTITSQNNKREASEENEKQRFKIQKNKPTVLIVDDDADIRNYIADEFKSHFNTITSSSGKNAFPLILKNQPDLIISDVMMPFMNGLDLSRKVKKNININHIPIILLTGKTDKETNLEGLETGADAYMNKPFNVEILKKTAKNLIRNRDLLRNTYSGNQLQDDKIKKVDLKSSDEILLQKFMDYINKNLDKQDLNVETIASELGMSRVHLYRKLKELTNQSATEFIRNIRLKQAGELLKSKQISVSEVAYAVGFSNISKFSTKFKEFYGVPPTSYRQKNNFS